MIFDSAVLTTKLMGEKRRFDNVEACASWYVRTNRIKMVLSSGNGR
jgi:hypothetical protein